MRRNGKITKTQSFIFSSVSEKVDSFVWLTLFWYRCCELILPCRCPLLFSVGPKLIIKRLQTERISYFWLDSAAFLKLLVYCHADTVSKFRDSLHVPLCRFLSMDVMMISLSYHRVWEFRVCNHFSFHALSCKPFLFLLVNQVFIEILFRFDFTGFQFLYFWLLAHIVVLWRKLISCCSKELWFEHAWLLEALTKGNLRWWSMS